MKKKYMALLLAILLLATLLPTALALNGDGEETKAEETGESAEIEEPAEEAEKASGLLEAEEPAEETEEEEAAPEEAAPAETVTVGEEDSFCAAAGQCVFNNGGTVYNNGATVYNNGGLVYNNAGTVYNNGGTVYANGGTVYNNGGEVFSNGALIYTHGGSVSDALIHGSYRVSVNEEAENLAVFEGVQRQGKSYVAFADTEIRVSPKPGYSILDCKLAGARGRIGDDGVLRIDGIEKDVELSVRFRADAPELGLESGSFVEPRVLTLDAAEGLEIYYTLDGSLPEPGNAQRYDGAIALTESCVVTAVCAAESAELSEAVVGSYAFPSFTAPTLEELDEGYQHPRAAVIEVDNSGPADAVLLGLSLEGEDAEAFTLGKESGGTVAAGTVDSRSWTVRAVKGLEKGSYEASVRIELDSGDVILLPIHLTVK